jgi:fumarate reductase flavoprotein subunit
VNKNGDRYIDESLRLHYPDSASTALCRQPGKTCYALLDTAVVNWIKQHREPLCGLERDMGRNGIWVDELENNLEKGVTEGKIVKAGSWEIIAADIGADPDVLLETVNKYNKYCKEGYDPEFLKDRKYLKLLNRPPYFAIPGIQSFDTTMGGIRINHKAEVISRQDRPIKGLYAAGDTATGTESVSYNHKYPGSALCFALIYGQVAGENAARYVGDQKRRVSRFMGADNVPITEEL